jgi:AraC-like DNA-binding protein
MTWSHIARLAHYKPQAIARLCGVNIRTLQRHFRKHQQTTLSTWLTHHRMQQAHQIILAGASVKEACFELGYKQPSHFTRVFRSEYGFPPSFLLSRQPHLPFAPPPEATRHHH